MARVARRAGQRGRTIPAPPPGRPPATRRDARLAAASVVRTWTLGPGARRTGAPRYVRGESGQVRRTAAIIAAGALVFLAGCSGDDAGRVGRTPADGGRPGRRCRSPSPTARPTSRPSCPLEISVTDGELGDVTVVDGDGAEVPGAVADVAGAARHRGLDAGGAAGLRHELHRSPPRPRTPTTRRRRRPRPSPPSPRPRVSTPSHRPARRHDRRRRHADPRLLRRPGRRQGRRREPPPGHQLHARPTASWNWFSDSEVHFRPVAVLAGRTPR